jgi:hypothetical protein
MSVVDVVFGLLGVAACVDHLMNYQTCYRDLNEELDSVHGLTDTVKEELNVVCLRRETYRNKDRLPYDKFRSSHPS